MSPIVHSKREKQRRKEKEEQATHIVTRSTSRNRDPSPNCAKGRSTKRSLSTHTSQNSSVSKKLKSTPATSSSTEEIPTTIKKRPFGRDSFCWNCHKLADDEVVCSQCPRIYHQKCLKKGKTQPQCECMWTNLDGTDSPCDFPADLNTLLFNAFIQITTNKEKKNKKQPHNENEFEIFKSWPENCPKNSLLTKIMDHEVILDRTTNKFYENYGQIVCDMKWIYHNCCIAYGFEDERTILAMKQLKLFKQEICDLEACPDCYREKSNPRGVQNDFFVKVCSKPHDIVWAKLKGFKFWPAKCLRIANGHADVRFFGTHDMSLIQLMQNKKYQVYRISKNNPSGCQKQTKNSYYDEALRELNCYIANYVKHFGNFDYFPDKTPLAEKCGKGKNKRKSRNQQEGPMDTDINGHYDSTQPQLNVSFLHDDSADIKTVCKNVLSQLQNITPDGNNEDIAQGDQSLPYNVEMLFHEENDGIEGTSNSQEEQPVRAVSNEDSPDIFLDIPSCHVLLNNVETKVPTSETPIFIASTESLSGSSSTGNTPKVSEYGSQSSSHENFTFESFTGNASASRTTVNTTDDDDEIQLISEKNSDSLVKSAFKHDYVYKTLADMLFCNKPNVRNYIAAFQNETLKLYLKMWLDLNNAGFKQQDIRMISSVYEKLVPAVQSLKTENEKIKKENKQLQQEYNKLLQDKVTDFAKLKAVKNERDLNYFRSEARKLNKELKEIKAQSVSDQCKLKEEFESKLSQLEAEKKALIHDKQRLVKEKNELLTKHDKTLLNEIQELKKDLKSCTCRTRSVETVRIRESVRSVYGCMTIGAPPQNTALMPQGQQLQQLQQLQQSALTQGVSSISEGSPNSEVKDDEDDDEEETGDEIDDEEETDKEVDNEEEETDEEEMDNEEEETSFEMEENEEEETDEGQSEEEGDYEKEEKTSFALKSSIPSMNTLVYKAPPKVQKVNEMQKRNTK